MSKEYVTISDGTYTLCETDNSSQFYFFRNDGKVFDKITDEPSIFFEDYIANKMAKGEIKNTCIFNLQLQLSDDKKVIRLTSSGFDEEISKEKHQPKKFLINLLNFFKPK